MAFSIIFQRVVVVGAVTVLLFVHATQTGFRSMIFFHPGSTDGAHALQHPTVALVKYGSLHGMIYLNLNTPPKL